MTDFLGYVGLALLLSVGPMYVALRIGASRKTRACCLVISLSVWLVPWFGQSLVYYVRGVTGDISVASLALMLTMYSQMLLHQRMKYRPVRFSIGITFLAMTLPLYASCLGYWAFDLYGWGYDPRWMLLATGLLMLWVWSVSPQLALAWLVGVTCFATGWLPSRNLWDALVDPFMAMAGVWIVAEAVLQKAIGYRDTKPSIDLVPVAKAA